MRRKNNKNKLNQYISSQPWAKKAPKLQFKMKVQREEDENGKITKYLQRINLKHANEKRNTFTKTTATIGGKNTLWKNSVIFDYD